MDRLRKLREEKHLKQDGLGTKLNIAQSTISLYESGERSPDPHTLIRLAEFFAVSVDYLLGITDIRLPADKLVLDNLSPEEAQLVSDYRSLSRDGRSRVLGYVDALNGK